MRDDRLYLIHVRECIERIEQYTTDGEHAFFQDTRTQDAVIRNLHTLAESTQRGSGALRTTQPGVDWRGIGAFRNVVVHNYLGIDLKQIWDIVMRDLPQFKGQILAILEELGPAR